MQDISEFGKHSNFRLELNMSNPFVLVNLDILLKHLRSQSNNMFWTIEMLDSFFYFISVVSEVKAFLLGIWFGLW